MAPIPLVPRLDAVLALITLISLLLVAFAHLSALVGSMFNLSSLLAAAGLGAALFALGCVALTLQRQQPTVPRLFYRHDGSLSSIIDSVPLLHSRLPQPALLSSHLLQMVVFGAQILFQQLCCSYEFEREEVAVELDDGRARDAVMLSWLHRKKDKVPLPAEAPIVLICPGLCNHEYNLPGTHVYRQLLKRPWRVAVFLKRGVAAPLRAPVVHVFGHPADLKMTVNHITARYPHAPIHIVGFSAGNGVGGSLASLHAQQCPAVRSYLLLCGGSDFRHIEPEQPQQLWPYTPVLLNLLLTPSIQANLVARHEKVLRAHDAGAYAEVMAATSVQEVYDGLSAHFSGHEGEAESQSAGVQTQPAAMSLTPRHTAPQLL